MCGKSGEAVLLAPLRLRGVQLGDRHGDDIHADPDSRDAIAELADILRLFAGAVGHVENLAHPGLPLRLAGLRVPFLLETELEDLSFNRFDHDTLLIYASNEAWLVQLEVQYTIYVMMSIAYIDLAPIRF